MEKCSFRLGPCAYQSSGMEKGSDTSQTGWKEGDAGGECVCQSEFLVEIKGG